MNPTTPDFKQMAVDLNTLLAWARSRVTDRKECTGAMSFTGNGGSNVAPFPGRERERLRTMLKSMGLIELRQFRGCKEPIWWVKFGVKVSPGMAQQAYYRRSSGPTEAELRKQIDELRQRLAKERKDHKAEIIALKTRVRAALE